MNELRYQVQIVSSQVDLEQERQIIEEALAAQSSFACGIAYPFQTDNYLWKLNQNSLRDSDYAIILIGNQYGAISPSGVGYIHRNFASAQALGKPVLSLIYTGSAKKPLNDTDKLRLVELKTQLKKGMYCEWENQDDLRQNIETSFEAMVEKFPSRGWTRPEHVMQNSGQEVLALRKQVNLLKRELEKMRLGQSEDSSTEFILLPYQCKTFTGGTLKNIKSQTKWKWDRLYAALGPLMLEETVESKVKAGLFSQILDSERRTLTQSTPEAHAYIDLKLPTTVFNSIKVKLRAKGLVSIRQGKWKLTPLGEHRLFLLSESAASAS